MSSTKASNAVLAIARAKFGKRVTDAQLKAMAALSNVEEIADYLKNNTAFSEALEDSGTTLWRRGSLEAALEKHNLFEFYSLCSFEKKIGSPVFSLFMMQVDANEIISFIRFLISGRPDKYSFTVLPYAEEMTGIDLLELSKVRSLEGLAEYLSDYELYRPVVKLLKGADAYSALNNIVTLENLLDKLVYNKSVSILKENFSGKELEELLSLYRLQIETVDVETVYRARHIFGESPDIAKSLVVGEGSLINKAKWQKLVSAETPEEFMEILKKTRYGKHSGLLVPENFAFMRQTLLESALHMMRFSSSPAAVMLAYITYLRIERRNIVHIIEGVRYGLDSEEIIKSLNLTDSMEAK